MGASSPPSWLWSLSLGHLGMMSIPLNVILKWSGECGEYDGEQETLKRKKGDQ
jgi:hypothetical protein